MSKFLASLRKAALLRQGGRCTYCDLPIWETDPEPFQSRFGLSKTLVMSLRATAEHLVARQDGGGDTVDNIDAACIHCNRTRHRSKRPPSPSAFRERVRTRMASRRWHPACTCAAFPLLAGAARIPDHTPGSQGTGEPRCGGANSEPGRRPRPTGGQGQTAHQGARFTEDPRDKSGTLGARKRRKHGASR